MKCLGRADTPRKRPTCESGLCRCVDHDECPEDRSCIGGECQGMLKTKTENEINRFPLVNLLNITFPKHIRITVINVDDFQLTKR